MPTALTAAAPSISVIITTYNRHDALAAQMAPWAEPQVINVPVRTLDSLLEEADAPQPLDFLSVDVEGHEIEVLRGFDFARWEPRLILMEDHIANLNRHRFMKAKGYRLVRRTELNGWYVPANAPIRFGLGDNIHVLRKYFLGLHLRKMRHGWRRLFYDRAHQRHSRVSSSADGSFVLAGRRERGPGLGLAAAHVPAWQLPRCFQ
jgi:hypothetical protein